jgi:hypothetical protein
LQSRQITVREIIPIDGTLSSDAEGQQGHWKRR